ncbi:S8 family peptidase [Lentzea kentuckyensis]|uniref:S8 family peptidase n=1 Tax=Lentzea kentuckyensis TaxID=360086 RepID=UPI001B80DB23|nr:S8 family peptidase [Lentzea kentuckyensis]
MSEPASASLTHLTVLDRAEDRDFHRRGGGDPRIRDVERRDHGGKLRGDLQSAFTQAEADRSDIEDELTLEELKALGVILVLDAGDQAFPLKLDSLERMSPQRKTPKRPQWLLLSVTPSAAGQPESAVVWVSDEYRAKFLQLFEDFLNRQSPTGNPRNRELVANIGRIRRAVLLDLWQSAGEPPAQGLVWWELWLTPSNSGLDLLNAYADATGLRVSSRRVEFADRTVVWIEARWDDLQVLPFTAIPLAEVRRPEFVDTIEDLSLDDQNELTTDLLGRTTVAAVEAAAVVCHLDSGVRRSHVLLSASLAPADVHSVVDSAGTDRLGHGTLMAGLALYGPLDDVLLSAKPVVLTHRLESVKILPEAPAVNDPLAYGLVTAQAAAAAEASAADRRRVFCMPITSPPEARFGEPSLWSASIDALAVGTDIGQSDGGISLLGQPDPAAARLFLISAGNVNAWESSIDYRDVCDAAGIQDPAQAWNALVVGAHTDLTSIPSDPNFTHWTPLAATGDLSPHSRTSLLFGTRPWPLKPDICMEGGNVLTDGVDFHDKHPLLTVRTTSHRNDLALTSANATSAATAQASRLAAKAMAAYPTYWPETIRGLLVHAAEWTPAMKAEIDNSTGKTARQAMLRRYGWGVPTEEAVLTSSRNAVTLVTQDEFVPFDGPTHRARSFRLHRLPWPTETLRDLADTQIQLRITLSYFIEPAASRRGWRRRYAYASHGLRFELRSPLEQRVDDFLARVNRDAHDEETGSRPPSGSDRWVVGSNQRNLGSLHHDMWDGAGAELADSDLIAVYPVGGWWKNNKRADRANLPLRYSLIVSLRTPDQDIDLYTPIATALRVPIAVEIDER